MDETRILVIDDDPVMLTTIESIFKVYEPGFEIILLNRPDNVIEIIEKRKPQVIITDLEMPGKSGIEVIQEVRKHKYFDFIPIIMSTGVKNSSENLMTALAAGANDFIIKPFDNLILIARSRSMLSLSMTLHDLRAQNAIISENNNFIRSLIRSSPQPLVYYTIEGIIMDFNDAFINFTGLNAEKLRGALVYRRFNSEHADYHLKMDSELIKNGGLINYETSNENEAKFLLFSKTLYIDTLCNPEGIMCVMTDVSEVRRVNNEILENKKRELVSSALRLIQISEQNDKLIRDLTSIQVHTNKKGTEIIQKLIKEYNSQQHSMTWQEFEMRFENVYESFYQRLKEEFPGLSNSEKKLCALLRLNLSSKEIATLTSQDAKSVDMARYRLRKKLGLAQEQNLSDYLNQF